MQVDPIKPTLKAPRTKRLKLKYNKLLSSFAFNFNLRRYTKAPQKFGAMNLMLLFEDLNVAGRRRFTQG